MKTFAEFHYAVTSSTGMDILKGINKWQGFRGDGSSAEITHFVGAGQLFLYSIAPKPCHIFQEEEKGHKGVDPLACPYSCQSFHSRIRILSTMATYYDVINRVPDFIAEAEA